MNELPTFKLEPPFKWLKRIEKFDTSVFPDCYTIEREWHIRKGISLQRNIVYVHHDYQCKFSAVRMYTEKGQLTFEELLK